MKCKWGLLLIAAVDRPAGAAGWKAETTAPVNNGRWKSNTSRH